MSIIIAFIVAHIGTVLTAAGALAAVITAWFHGKSTGATQATQAAQATVDTAKADASVARQQAAQSVADTEQAQQTLKDVQTAGEAMQAAQQIPDDQLDAKLAQLGALRKD